MLANRLSPTVRFWMKLGIFFFVFLSLIAGFIAFLEGEMDQELLIVPIAALIFFSLPALVYCGFKLTAHLQYRKYGDSHFISDLPAKIGQRLEGVVETSIAISKRPTDSFQLTVRRVRTSTYNDDGKTRYRSSTQWEASKFVDAVIEAGKNKLIIPISFDLPNDQSPSRGATSWGGKGVGSKWQLIVRAKVAGLDYRATFLFPVIQ